jgi:hypothetical protein
MQKFLEAVSSQINNQDNIGEENDLNEKILPINSNRSNKTNSFNDENESSLGRSKSFESIIKKEKKI